MPVRGAVTENTDSSDASVAEAFGWVDLSLQVLFIDMSNVFFEIELLFKSHSLQPHVRSHLKRSILLQRGSLKQNQKERRRQSRK